MLPLPVPQGGGPIEALAPFLNLPNRDDFVLVVAWLLATPAGRRPLSRTSDIGRAGFGQDGSFEAAQGFGRPERGAGAGTRARGTRPRDRRQQFACACLRQFVWLGSCALRCVLPARHGRELRAAPALHGRRRGAVSSSTPDSSQWH